MQDHASLSATKVSLRLVETLFDSIPDVVFFMKDLDGRYLAVNQTLVMRCGLRNKNEIIGRKVSEIFPTELGHSYLAQDRSVLRTGISIDDKLEMHLFPNHRQGWCLTTKLALHDGHGSISGLIGLSRDVYLPGYSDKRPPHFNISTIVQTLDYLRHHFDEPISTSILAEKAGISSARFARVIKHLYHFTPGQLIIQTRINEATRLLTETENSVSEIAYACGFSDHSAFTRQFKATTHLTPLAYRRLFSSSANNQNQ